MPELIVESRDGGRCLHHAAVDSTGSPIGFAVAMERLESAAEFRHLITTALADAPFRAFRWETPPVSRATIDRPFEFVLVDAPGLDRPADTRTFAAEFSEAPVVTFENLGRDAMLVVPCPRGDAGAYVHLGSFVRQGPAEQIHELWRAVGAAVRGRVGDRPLWLSTAGGGVAWLHVRLDARPKYYAYRPFAADDGARA